MRIIRGSRKGRQIILPKKLSIRPTTDISKEGLFNIIEHNYDFDGLAVLDLFAGTGSISYEFASRGCSNVTSVDISSRNILFIKKNCEVLDFDVITTIKSDAFRFLRKQTRSYDIIFADPPYDEKKVVLIPDHVFNNQLLNDDGWLIVEHSKHAEFEKHPNFIRTKKYGKVNFSFFENISDKT